MGHVFNYNFSQSKENIAFTSKNEVQSDLTEKLIVLL